LHSILRHAPKLALIWVAAIGLAVSFCYRGQGYVPVGLELTAIPRFHIFPPKKLRMDDSDPIASIYDCEDRLIVLGGGICEIPPHSIKFGKHTKLERRWGAVLIAVKQ